MKQTPEEFAKLGKPGKPKTSRRLALDNEDLISLLSNHSIKEIADIFYTSKYMVAGAIERQFKDRVLSFKEYHQLKSAEDEMDLDCEGAWMHSAEREQIKQFITIKNLEK